MQPSSCGKGGQGDSGLGSNSCGHAPQGRRSAGLLCHFGSSNLDGEGLRQRRIEERRDKFSRLVAGVDSIVFSEVIDAEGAIVFAHACKLGLEGIVSKRAGCRYSSGNSRQWLKSKNPEFERT